MRKILFITGSLPPMACGVGYYTASLLENMVDQDDNITVLTAAVPKGIDPRIKMAKASGWRLRDLPGLISESKKIQPDIIHIQYPSKGYGRKLGINLLPYLLRLFVRKPRLVITLHEYFGSPLLGRTRGLITIACAQHIIVSNEADLHALPSFLKRRARIIPIGSSIEVNHPDTAGANELVQPKDMALTVLFFGFAFPAKQLELLIEAMAELPKKRLLIASKLDANNPYDRQLFNQISEHNDRKQFDQIRVVGFQKREILAALLKETFCFVLPQAIPLNTKSSTLVTALRYNTPVVGKKGAAWENKPLVNGQNSILLDEITPDSLVEAISQLDDPEFRQKLKTGASKLAEDYSWEAITKLHQQMYQELAT